MSRHADQLASVLRQSIQSVITRGLGDPRIRGLVTVTQVKVAEDLADATVMVSVLPREHEQLTLHGLAHAAPHVRARVSKMVSIRRIPRLAFKLDPSLKRAADLDAALGAERHEPPDDTARAATEDLDR